MYCLMASFKAASSMTQSLEYQIIVLHGRSP
jgi:hypothetical protein